MRKLLQSSSVLLITLLFTGSAFASVWVTNVVETNPPSLECTPTFVTVSGDLSATHMFTNAVVNVVGFNIEISVNFSSGIGLPVITPFSEDVDLGLLPAGTYSITTNGYLDMTQHSTFSSSLVVGSCCSANAAFSNPNSVCINVPTLLTNTSTGTTGQEWYEDNVLVSAATDYTFTALTPGMTTIKLVVTNGSCLDSVEYNINAMNPPVINSITPSATDLCDGATLTISSSATGAFGYTWFDNAINAGNGNNLNTTVSGPGAHTYILVASNGACVDSMETVVNVLAAPSIDTFNSTDTTICLGESVDLTSTSTGATALEWTENGSSVGSTDDYSATPTTAGFFTYQLMATNANCADSMEHTVEVFDVPTVDLGPDTNICAGSVLLNAGSGMAAYEWQDMSTAQSFVATTSGTYSVTVTNDDGCSSYDEVVIEPCASIEELNPLNVSVYPNPTSGKLFIDLTGVNTEVTVNIIDNNGRIVLTDRFKKSSIVKINLEKLQDGFYYLNLSTVNNSYIRPLIKE